MDADWTIKPRSGLGALKFGMSPDDIAALRDIYGTVEGTRTNEGMNEAFERTKALFGKYLSEDDIVAVQKYARQSEENHGFYREVLSAEGLVLDYNNKKLNEITVLGRNKEINFQEKLISTLDSRDILMLFEKNNGAPGRYGSTGAAFDDIAVYLDSFNLVTEDGVVQPMPQTDERFRERTISLREEPYSQDEMLPDSVTQSFL